MITVSIAGSTPAEVAKQAGELAALLGGKPAAPAAAAAKPAAAPAPAKPAAAAKPAAPKPAAKPAPAPAPAAPAEGEVTLQSLRDKGRAILKLGKNDEMKAALAALGADTISTTDPTRYAELDVALQAIIDGGGEAAPGEDQL